MKKRAHSIGKLAGRLLFLLAFFSIAVLPLAAVAESPMQETAEYSGGFASSLLGAIPAARTASGIAFAVLIMLMIVFYNIDRRHPRRFRGDRAVTVIVPCYNDGESVQSTLASIFRSYPSRLLEVIVVNDASTDDSLEKIREFSNDRPLRIVDNCKNMGKAKSLNNAARLASNDLVLCLDADTLLNKAAMSDMIARMEADERLGAVSSAYRPQNTGFLPVMQAIEYSMLLLTQGAHNITSAMALWGGCLMFRKKAFAEVGGFNPAAITEDVDLAFRLNRRRWRVEQSFRPVRSIVPDRPKKWIRQKLRWTAGGMQCYVRHARVWIKNPIQIFFIMSYSMLLLTTIPDLFDKIEIAQSLENTWNSSLPWHQNLLNVNTSVGSDILRRLSNIAICYVPSLIYIIPLVHRMRDIWKFVLVIPFSLIYFPAYIFVSVFGMAKGIRSLLLPMKSDTQGWVN